MGQAQTPGDLRDPFEDKDTRAAWGREVRSLLRELTAVAERAAGGDLLDEHGYGQAVLTVTVQPAVAGTWELRSVIVVVPTDATSATLRIGKRRIPVQQTPFVLSPVNMIMNPNENVTVEITGTPGEVFVEVMGIATGLRR